MPVLNSDRVFFGQKDIRAQGEVKTSSRGEHCCNERFRLKCRRVENDRVDYFILIELIPGKIEKESCAISNDRTTEISAVPAGLKRRPKRCIRVASVERFVVETQIEAAMKSVHARFSDDLDAAKTCFGKLCRKRIRVYIDSENGFLWWNLA